MDFCVQFNKIPTIDELALFDIARIQSSDKNLTLMDDLIDYILDVINEFQHLTVCKLYGAAQDIAFQI
jgi:hypothetical protein